MVTYVNLVRALVFAFVAVGLGGCPAMSALTFEPAKQFVEAEPTIKANGNIYLYFAGEKKPAPKDEISNQIVAKVLEEAQCLGSDAPLVATSLLITAGASYASGLVKKSLIEYVDTLVAKSTATTDATYDHSVESNRMADCIIFTRTIEAVPKAGQKPAAAESGSSDRTPTGTGKPKDGPIVLAVALKKKALGKMTFYELVGAQSSHTLAMTKRGDDGQKPNIDLSVALSITGASADAKKAVRHTATFEFEELTLDGAWHDAASKGDPFPPIESQAYRYEVVVTEVGDLGFVPKDATADLKTFFELVGPSYDAFVQNRIVIPRQ